MHIVYACQTLPPTGEEGALDSIFLAGPTPRDPETPSWRPEAIRLLEELGFQGSVFVPETEGGGWHGDYLAQVHWEWRALGRAARVVFWVPRELARMPGFTTNVELGFLAGLRPERVVLGAPQDAPKLRYLETLARDQDVFRAAFGLGSRGSIPVAHSLRETLSFATS